MAQPGEEPEYKPKKPDSRTHAQPLYFTCSERENDKAENAQSLLRREDTSYRHENIMNERIQKMIDGKSAKKYIAVEVGPQKKKSE